MKKFTIAIEETVVQEFEEKYNKGEFVLAPGEVQFRQMASIGDDPTEWKEF